MTWVVGASSILGYGVMVSDVRITFADGSEVDILKKAYPVGPYMLAGFAGSVFIGMTLIDHLQHCLNDTLLSNNEQAPASFAYAFNPDVIAEQWSPRAAEIFASMPEAEQVNGSQILLVGIDSARNNGSPEFPYVHIVKMTWPDFKPQFSPQSWHAQHIGSGSDIEQFVASISEHFKVTALSLQAESAGPNGWASMLGYSVGRMVKEHPIAGVGAHVNVDVCRLGGFSHGTNDENIFYLDGRIDEFRMPRIAHNYEEFQQLCDGLGKGAVGAVG